MALSRPSAGAKTRIGAWIGMALLGIIVAGMAACERQPSLQEEVHDPEVGKTVASQGWVVTLYSEPYSSGQIGEGTFDVYHDFDDAVARPEGVFLMVPIRVVSEQQEMDFFPKELFSLTDSQGREFPQGSYEAHLSHVNQAERWDGVRNMLIRNWIDPGGTLEGPLIFDVAEDASGLRLRVEGSEDSFDLGL